MFVQRIKESVRETLLWSVYDSEKDSHLDTHTHRKNKIVTRHRGYMDSRRVNSAAFVLSLSLIFSECFLKIAIMRNGNCFPYTMKQEETSTLPKDGGEDGPI